MPLAGLSNGSALVIFTGAVTAIPLVVAVWRRRFDPFEPVVVAALAYAAMFVARPAAMLILGQLTYDRPSRAIDISGQFANVQLLALLGAVGLMLGYYLPAGRSLARRLPRPPAAIHTDTAVTGALGAGALGLLLFGLFLYSGGGATALQSFLAGRDASQVDLYRKSTGYLYTGPFLLIPAALLLIATARSRRNIGLTVLGMLFAALLLLQSAPIGGRISILPLLGSLLLFQYVSRHRRPRAVSLLIIGVLALAGSQVLLLSRNVNDPGYAHAIEQTARDPISIFLPITEQPDAEMAPALAAVIQAGSAEGGAKRGYATLGELFVRPIPRLLWHEKPLPPRQQIIRDTWPVEYSAGIANPEFSVLLYFFLDLSYAGALLGMFVIGLLLRALSEYFALHPDNLVAQMAFSALVPFIPILLRDSPTDTTIKLAFSVVPLLVICWLARDRGLARDAAPPGSPASIDFEMSEPVAAPA